MKKFMRQILCMPAVMFLLLGVSSVQLNAMEAMEAKEFAAAFEQQSADHAAALKTAAESGDQRAFNNLLADQAKKREELLARAPKAPPLPKSKPPALPTPELSAETIEEEPGRPVTQKASGEVKPAKEPEPVAKGKAAEVGGEGANEVAEQLGADIEKLRAKLKELKLKKAALKEAGESYYDVDLEILGVQSQLAGKQSLKTAAIVGGVAVTGLATVETGVNLYKDINPDKNQSQVIIEQQPIEIQTGGTTDGTEQTTTNGKAKTKKPKKSKTKRSTQKPKSARQRERELQRQEEEQILEEEGYVTPKKKSATKKSQQNR